MEKFSKIILFLKKFFKFPEEYNWDEHSFSVKKLGEELPNNFLIFELPDQLIKNLNLFFENCENFSLNDNKNENKLKNRNKPNNEKWSKIFKFNKFKKIKGDIFSYNNKILMDLCVNLKNQLDLVLKKPFIFVGLKMWDTIPSSEEFGMYEFHKDGFEPYHSKIMIYLQQLDENYGSLQIDEKKFFSDKPLAIWFKNSDILHKGIPGKKFNRRVIELTIMQTVNRLSNDNVFKNILPHNYDERHLKKPSSAYK